MDAMLAALVTGSPGIGFGLWVFWMIATGRLVTRREADAKDAEITALRTQNQEQGKQLTLVLQESMPTVTSVLAALHAAAETTGDHR